MDKYKHFKAFCATTGIPRSYQGDFFGALDYEAVSVREETRRTRGRACRWDRAVDTAAARILEWFQHADEYHDQVSADLPGFVISHRKACVWAVLLGLYPPGGAR